MKATATYSDLAQSGSLGGDKIDMDFDPTALAHIMSVLTDLYSDPILAFVREYGTNAYDSHVEAGQTKPIEVYTPGRMSPYFKVKDYGVGLSHEDIKRVYARYGASTKRDTNEQTGMLGLGGKSALTYADQFVVTSVKDGLKIFVSISRKSDGTGTMTVIDSGLSNEPNGVEISIPIQPKDFDKVREKAKHFYSFWKPGTVLLDGKEPSFESQKWLNDTARIVDGLDSDYILMGNVAYPLDSRIFFGGYNVDFGTVVEVPIGSVAFTPSREQLHYTPATQRTIAEVKRTFQATLSATIVDDVAQADNFADAIKRKARWKNRTRSAYNFRMPEVKFNGYEVPDKIRLDYQMFNVGVTRNALTSNTYMNVSTLDNIVFVTGFTAEKLSSPMRSKLRIWAANNGNNGYFALVEKMPDDPFLLHVKSVNIDDVKKIKLVYNQTGTKRVRTWDVADGSFRYTDAVVEDDIDMTQPVYWYGADEAPNTSQYKVLTRALGDATVIKVKKNRKASFEKTFPKAVHISEFIKLNFEKAKADLTEVDMLSLTMDYYSRNILIRLNANKVDDPNVKLAIEAAKATNTHTNNLSLTLTAYNNWSSIMAGFAIWFGRVEEVDHLAGYPLVKGARYFDEGHIYIYMNAVYAARKDI